MGELKRQWIHELMPEFAATADFLLVGPLETGIKRLLEQFTADYLANQTANVRAGQWGYVSHELEWEGDQMTLRVFRRRVGDARRQWGSEADRLEVLFYLVRWRDAPSLQRAGIAWVGSAQRQSFYSDQDIAGGTAWRWENNWRTTFFEYLDFTESVRRTLIHGTPLHTPAGFYRRLSTPLGEMRDREKIHLMGSTEAAISNLDGGAWEITSPLIDSTPGFDMECRRAYGPKGNTSHVTARIEMLEADGGGLQLLVYLHDSSRWQNPGSNAVATELLDQVERVMRRLLDVSPEGILWHEEASPTGLAP